MSASELQRFCVAEDVGHVTFHADVAFELADYQVIEFQRFTHVRQSPAENGIFAAVAADRPLVVTLEDLHWADPASLDLLRALGRGVAPLPLLYLATYRPDEVPRRHPLTALIPVLVREAPVERFGLRLVASPRHADVLVVTGPVTLNMREALERTYAAMPGPKWVVAVGDCAAMGGLFAGGYACAGGADSVLPLDLRIPGCPPTPTALLKGLLALFGSDPKGVRASTD